MLRIVRIVLKIIRLCGMVWYGVVWCGMVWYGIIKNLLVSEVKKV